MFQKILRILTYIVTMALSCIISEIKQNIGRKSSFFHTPLHSTPPLRSVCRNSAMKFGTEKLEWLGYPTVKKIEYTFIRFHMIHERDGRAYRQTDRHRMTTGLAYASHRAAKMQRLRGGAIDLSNRSSCRRGLTGLFAIVVAECPNPGT